MSKDCINATAQAIIDRLPATSLLSPSDISSAIGLKTCHSISDAAQEGKIAAIKVGNKILISRQEAIRWITTLTYQG